MNLTRFLLEALRIDLVQKEDLATKILFFLEDFKQVLLQKYVVWVLLPFESLLEQSH